MTTPRNDRPILIIGGGIGGLACALALAKHGFAATVLEQAPEFGEIGVGLQVAPNALTVLDALGVGHLAKKHALLIERMLLRDGVTGETICDIPCDQQFVSRFGNPYAVAHRADILDALLAGCRLQASKILLKNNAKVTDFHQSKRGVTVTFESGETLDGLALIGADGVRSVVRQRIVTDGDPVSAGAMIFRALIPANEMPPEKHQNFPTLWAGPGSHLIHYPLRDRTTFNVGATVVTDVSGISEGSATPDEVLSHFGSWTPQAIDILKIPKKYVRYLIRHRLPVENWTRENVTLLGDAAHPMVQYIAQGAAMALEDAVCLAAQLERHDGDCSAAFAAYQAIRIVRTARVQLSSLMLDKIYHASGVERLVRNSIFEGRGQAEHLERLAWLFAAPDYVSQPLETQQMLKAVV